ncbi:hypothetical protein ACFHW2_20675 [Actinomadura sp. LOL_016]|uniref:hypothetical protein n=1 Tax=unclassified Actinomadura TaxID=2626254 RepID=UPI003A80EB7C
MSGPAPAARAGTAGWIAPEQIAGREVTPAADVFAWGCLVAYASTGNNPFGRGSFELLSARDLLLALAGGDTDADAATALDARPLPAQAPRRHGRTLAVVAAVALVAAASGVGLREWRSSLPPDDPMLVAIGLDAGCADTIGLHEPGSADPERLVSEVWCVQNPQRSPDHARIAFTFHDPAWSSTGLLAFSYREEKGPPRVHVVDPDAPKEWRAVTPDGVDARAPAWSPDGATIAYTALEPGLRDGGPEQRDIWLISATGTPNRRELEVAGNAASPSWSPDGEWICYVRDGEDLRAARTNGEGDRSVTPEDGAGTLTMPDWS